MSMLRRILGVDKPSLEETNPNHVLRVVETEEQLTKARQDFRQSLQRVYSGSHVFQTNASAMRILRNARDENRR